MATEINARPGGNGRRFIVSEETLASGTVDVSTKLRKVEYVFVTQKDSTAVAHGVAWSASGGTVTLTASDSSNAETYSVLVIGY